MPNDPVSLSYQGHGGEIALTAIAKKNYLKASEALEVELANFPLGRNNQYWRFLLAEVYYRSNNLSKALAATESYLDLFPSGRYLTEIYYLRGLILVGFNRGRIESLLGADFSERDNSYVMQARNSFRIVLSRDPNGSFASSSREWLQYISDLLARREIRTAIFYYNKKAYVGAINRALVIIRNYPNTTANLPALRLLAKTYRQLGLSNEKREIEARLVKASLG